MGYRVFCISLYLSLCLAGIAGSVEADGRSVSVGQAAGEPALAAPAADADVAPTLGLNVNLEIASAYLFRGQNLFRENTDGPEQEQVLRLSPSLSWQVGGTGLSVGYWGAFQGTGSRLGDNVKAGIGAEQDLWVDFAHPLGEALQIGGSLVAYWYPFADSGDAWAGTASPLYLEPLLGVTLAGPIEVGLNLSWLTGVQPSLRNGSYVYVNPVLATEFPLHGDALTGELSAGLGYRIGTQGRIEEYRYDALLSLTVPWQLSAKVYLSPTLACTWGSRRGVGVRDEIALFGGLSLGRDQ